MLTIVAMETEVTDAVWIIALAVTRAHVCTGGADVEVVNGPVGAHRVQGVYGLAPTEPRRSKDGM